MGIIFYRIYPVVKPDTGEFSGNIAPYNEYYLVAYLANITSEESDSKVRNLKPHHLCEMALKEIVNY